MDEDQQFAEIIQDMGEREFLKLLRLDMRDAPSYLHRAFPSKEEWGNPDESKMAKAFNEKCVSMARDPRTETGNICDFSDAKFPYVSFEGVVSDYLILFKGAKFYRTALFDDAIFRNKVDFSNAEFFQHAYFGNTKFLRGAAFNNSIFLDPAVFTRSEFNHEINFGYAEFHNGLFFNYIEIRHSGVHFSNAVFRKYAEFGNCRKLGTSLIPGHIDDTSIEFYFNKADFTFVPMFHETEIHPRSSIHRANFKIEYDPLERRKGERRHGLYEADDRSEGNEGSYWNAEESASRVLKVAMEKIRHRQAEGVFHGLELDARRKSPDTPRHEKLILKIYGGMSKYGQNILRPFGYLIGVIALWSVIFSMITTSSYTSSPFLLETLYGLPEGIEWSLQQVVQPFSILSSTEDMSLKFLGALESLLAIPCIAMFILALRWQLRRG